MASLYVDLIPAQELGSPPKSRLQTNGSWAAWWFAPNESFDIGHREPASSRCGGGGAGHVERGAKDDGAAVDAVRRRRHTNKGNKAANPTKDQVIMPNTCQILPCWNTIPLQLDWPELGVPGERQWRLICPPPPTQTRIWQCLRHPITHIHRRHMNPLLLFLLRFPTRSLV